MLLITSGWQVNITSSYQKQLPITVRIKAQFDLLMEGRHFYRWIGLLYYFMDHNLFAGYVNHHFCYKAILWREKARELSLQRPLK